MAYAPVDHSTPRSHADMIETARVTMEDRSTVTLQHVIVTKDSLIGERVTGNRTRTAIPITSVRTLERGVTDTGATLMAAGFVVGGAIVVLEILASRFMI
jgi:hypothetical protein